MSDTPEETNASRRRFFALAGAAIGTVAIVAALPRGAFAADLPHLSSADPIAQPLHYTDDNTKAGPPHKAGDACNNCSFFSGGNAQYGPCQLFPGKAVHRDGWCEGYSKKA